MMRYGVQFQPRDGSIHAGAVRRCPDTGRELFIMQSDVTGPAIGAVALWLLTHEQPYRITDQQGTTYELTCVTRPHPEGA